MTRQPRAALPSSAAVAAVLALVWCLLAPVPADAGPTAAAQPDGRLDVVDQSGFVPSDGVYEAVLSWTGPTAGLDLEVSVFQLVDDADELDERSPAGRLNQLAPVPLTALPTDGDGHLVLRIPIRSQALPVGDPSRLYLPDAGVYPLQLEVTDDAGDTVASRFVDLIRLPTEVTGEPVPVAPVVSIGGGGLALVEAVELLERFPDVALTVLIDPSAVMGPDTDPALVARLGTALGDRPAATVEAVPLDVSALAEIGHLDLYDVVRRSAAEDLTAVLGRPVTSGVVTSARLPTAGAAEHLARTVDLLLAPTGTETGVIETSEGDLPVLSADEDLMAALASPSRAANQVLARLAIRYREGLVDPAVLTTEGGSGVSAADLAVVLEGLRQPSVAQAVPLAEAADRLLVGGARALRPSERPRQDLRPTADLLQAAIEDLADYRDFYVNGPVSPSYLRDRVLAALAVDVSPEQRVDRLASVRREIGDAFDVVSLPEGRTVNLAATTSQLPLAVTSSAAGLRRVRISFASDKLTFPEEGGDSRIVELDSGTTALEFVVESRSLGVSPLDVVVSTPDGSRELARTRITIRSTAVPGLGLLLSGAALAFLVGWWVLHAVRRRRSVPQVAGAEQVA